MHWLASVRPTCVFLSPPESGSPGQGVIGREGRCCPQMSGQQSFVPFFVPLKGSGPFCPAAGEETQSGLFVCLFFVHMKTGHLTQFCVAHGWTVTILNHHDKNSNTDQHHHHLSSNIDSHTKPRHHLQHPPQQQHQQQLIHPLHFASRETVEVIQSETHCIGDYIIITVYH